MNLPSQLYAFIKLKQVYSRHPCEKSLIEGVFVKAC